MQMNWELGAFRAVATRRFAERLGAILPNGGVDCKFFFAATNDFFKFFLFSFERRRIEPRRRRRYFIEKALLFRKENLAIFPGLTRKIVIVVASRKVSPIYVF